MRFGRDGIAGLIGLAVSLGLLPSAMQLPKLPIVPVGPGFYATIVLVFLAATSALLVVQDLAARRGGRRGGSEAGAHTPETPAYGLVLAAFAIVGGYITVLPYLGFRLSTLLFVALFQGALDRPRSLGQWLRLMAIALGTTLITYTVFEQYLSVLLPRGRWTDF